MHSFVAQGRVESQLTLEIRSEITARISAVHVHEGDTVEAGQVLFIMEVMKMEVPHEAPCDGTITAVHVAEGDSGLDARTVVEVLVARLAQLSGRR